MKFRPNILQLLLVVAILGILAGIFFPVIPHHHRLRPIREQQMFGYWIAITGPQEAFRLFLTNDGGGWLGSREIFTNLYKVTSWHVTNRDISIDLEPVTEPSWPHEYVRGKIGFGEFGGVRGGVNQSGERWTRDILFYREETVLQALGAATSIMTNQSRKVETSSVANRSEPVQPGTNPTTLPAGSGR